MTLLGVRPRTFPSDDGNCFSVCVSGAKHKEYKVCNFGYENIQHLFTKGLKWPVKVTIIGEWTAIINDERIPETYYRDTYCEICCPEDLLPEPQRAHLDREVRRGRRIKLPNGWVKRECRAVAAVQGFPQEIDA